ncbi:hypothetical protein [Streptomyces sp. NPDC006879]|uniref:hypothetical protein n=1 Tax=Streptomyces sp. NPDC006879 TaxID=3364767 RepID=UPI0036C589C1
MHHDSAGGDDARRRMRSGGVILGGVGLLAAALVGCGSDPDKRCADPKTSEQLKDSDCRDNGSGAYYYGGSSKKGKPSGGSFNKSAVDRGGFGATRSGGG